MTIEIKEQSIGITGVRSAADIFPKAGPVPPTGPAPMAGMFWCYTHMADLPTEKQSSDPRYCQQCYENLVKDADDMKAVGNYHKPWWIPCTRQPSGQDHVQVQGQVTQTPTVSVTPGNCLFCGKELTKRRKSKLFCGAVCRVRYSRQQNNTAPRCAVLSTENQDTVSPTLAEQPFVTSAVNHKKPSAEENFPQPSKSKKSTGEFSPVETL